MEERKIKLLREEIPLSNDFENIHSLKFLKDNPRVYACTHGHPNFENMMEEEQQEIILEKLLQEPSVKNLIPDVKRHGGLMEPILIRKDTMEVIEGNSRLAVYRKLYDDEVVGDWELIPCDIVSNLTEDQQAAFLNQIHVKGKTQWSPYEQANFAYVRKAQGWSFDKIAKLFGEAEGTIRTRVKIIEKMKQNEDNQQSHFSYYNVMVRSKEISEAMKKKDLSSFLLTKIKNFGPNDEGNDFTALELRQKFPALLRKPKVLKRLIDGKIDLDKGYQHAKISQVEERVRQAVDLLDDVERKDIKLLETARFNAFKQDARKLSRQVMRINGIIKDIDAK